VSAIGAARRRFVRAHVQARTQGRSLDYWQMEAPAVRRWALAQDRPPAAPPMVRR
jgi:hypothetical protein